MGWFSYGISGLLWLQMNRHRYLSTWRKKALTCLNVFIVLIGCVIVSSKSNWQYFLEDELIQVLAVRVGFVRLWQRASRRSWRKGVHLRRHIAEVVC